MVFPSLLRRVSNCVRKRIPLGALGSSELGSCSGSRFRLCSSSSEAVEFWTKTVEMKHKGNRQQRLHSVHQQYNSYLIGILNSEINFARNSDFLHCAVDTPEGFPFTILDNAGWRTVVLERKFQGESITVLVDIPSSPAEHGDDEEIDKEPSVPLAVVVSKENGLLLEFDGRLFPGRISVHGLCINKSGDSKDWLKCEGPDFLKLKQNFQKAIHDYLETRGMTSSTANFLLQYMMVKDAKEYLRWLRMLKVFIAQK